MPSLSISIFILYLGVDVSSNWRLIGVPSCFKSVMNELCTKRKTPSPSPNYLKAINNLFLSIILPLISVTNCGGDIIIAGPSQSSNATVITSPGFPNGYQNNLKCVYFITSPVGTRVKLLVNTMDLSTSSWSYSCYNDKLVLYESKFRCSLSFSDWFIYAYASMYVFTCQLLPECLSHYEFIPCHVRHLHRACMT